MPADIDSRPGRFLEAPHLPIDNPYWRNKEAIPRAAAGQNLLRSQPIRKTMLRNF